MTEKTIEQEKKFDILQSPAGDLLIVIKARLSGQMNPTIVYDGGEHALFERNGENTIVLDYINPAARESMLNATRVLVIEAQGESIVREYFSAIQKSDLISLPIELVA